MSSSSTSTLQLPEAQDARESGLGSVQFIGTATVLIRSAGFTVLTDPNFLHAGEKVHLGYGLTTYRLTNPAISFGELPEIDLVVLSHLHGDHFDQLVEERLDRAMPIVTTPTAAHALRRKGFSEARALKTWESLEVTRGSSRLRITSTPGQHGRLLLAALLPEVMGTVLEFSGSDGPGDAYRTYITGDTLLHSGLAEIGARYPDLDLSLLHLGGTRVLGVLATMEGKDGVELMRMVPSRRAIPIHYNDYPVFKSPLSDFQAAVQEAGLGERVRYLSRGDTYQFERR